MTADDELLPEQRPSRLDRAHDFLHSEGVDRLLADVAELNAAQQRITEARDEAGVKPGEPLIGPPIIPEEWRHMPTGQETRVVDPETGGAKGSKLARFDLIPEDVMWLLAEHYGLGAQKYEDRNWQKGYKWSLSYAAARRHLALFWQGEDIDSDPSLQVDGEARALHITAALWHCVALAWFYLHDEGTDDRFKTTEPE